MADAAKFHVGPAGESDVGGHAASKGLLASHLGKSLRLQRADSAPPNLADMALEADGGGWGSQAAGSNGGTAWGSGIMQGSSAEESLQELSSRDLDVLSDPSYVSYYYTNKNINPRLPPPRPNRETFTNDRKLPTGSRLQESSSRNDPWIAKPGGGLMGLSPLATRPKSLLSETANNGGWDTDYNLNKPSSPVFGHPSSPFAPTKPIGSGLKAQDDVSLLLNRTSKTSRAGRAVAGVGFGSAPGTPTRRSYVPGGADSYDAFKEEVGMRLSQPLSARDHNILSTSPPSLLGDSQPNLDAGRFSQPVTPTIGKPGSMEESFQPRSPQDFAAIHVAEQLTNEGFQDSRMQLHHVVMPSTTSSSLPSINPPANLPYSQDSFYSPSDPSLGHGSMLPDSMFSSNAHSSLSPMDFAAAAAAAINSSKQHQSGPHQHPTGLQFPNAPGPGQMLFQQPDPTSAAMQVQHLQAAAMMMHPMMFMPPGMHTNPLAQAAALGMAGGYPGLGMGLPPPINPALLMHMYGHQLPAMGPGNLNRAPDMAAYHQRMMEMYASMTQGGPQAAGDPFASIYAAAAGLHGHNPGSNPHSGHNSGKVSPEPQEGSGHSDGRHVSARGGKDASSRRRRGDSKDSDQEGASTCALLEQLKSNKTKKIELQDIVGHVMEFCTDQHGSRFIQLKLESSTAEETSAVFEEALPQAIPLMTDVFGNYVIQKFFEHGSDTQRERLADTLTTNILSLSLQMYGCRVVQKALETLPLNRQQSIVGELDGHVMRCVRDQNGNHVIQKCIECVPTEHVAFMIDSFKGQVVMLSEHPYGCRVVQRVLEYCTDHKRVRDVMTEVLRATNRLAQDQYGNYVVQHVLERGVPADRTAIITQLAGQVVEMSQHKFASNVIEKCLQHGSHGDRQLLIGEIMGHTEENGPLQMMMKDQFGNYVVQKLLEVCDDDQREQLLIKIRQHLHNLKKFTYGKHIVARVEKLLTNTQRFLGNTHMMHSTSPPEHSDQHLPSSAAASIHPRAVSDTPVSGAEHIDNARDSVSTGPSSL